MDMYYYGSDLEYRTEEGHISFYNNYNTRITALYYDPKITEKQKKEELKKIKQKINEIIFPEEEDAIVDFIYLVTRINFSIFSLNPDYSIEKRYSDFYNYFLCRNELDVPFVYTKYIELRVKSLRIVMTKGYYFINFLKVKYSDFYQELWVALSSVELKEPISLKGFVKTWNEGIDKYTDGILSEEEKDKVKIQLKTKTQEEVRKEITVPPLLLPTPPGI